MFYLEGVSDLKFRPTKTKDKPRQIVKTIKPNFSNLSYDGAQKHDEAAELILSDDARRAMEEEPNPNANVLMLSRSPLETKYYIVSENVEKKIDNLYDQINYLSIDLKNNM